MTRAQTLLIPMLFFINIAYSQVNVDSCVINWSGIDFTLPSHFQTMLNSQGQDTFYIAINEPGASNNNNGQFPTYQGGLDGPWTDFNGVSTVYTGGDSIGPGDVLMIRDGIYTIPDTTILSLDFNGTTSNPVRIMNYPGETPIAEGEFDSAWFYSVTHPVDTGQLTPYFTAWNNVPMVRVAGSHQIVEGITFRKSHLNTLLFRGSKNILLNCRFFDSMEDQIKSTVETDSSLILNCEFLKFGGEAIDIFGAQSTYIVECDFHDAFTDVNPRSDITIAWAKGGAKHIYYVNNYFHDTQVSIQGLVLGGCCWNNWTTSPYDSLNNVKPIAQYTYALGNRFHNISHDTTQTFNYKSVLSFEGSAYSEANYNIIHNCEYAIGIKETVWDSIVLPPYDLRFTNNVISHTSNARLYSIQPSFMMAGSIIDSNCTYTDGTWECYSGGSLTYPAISSMYGLDMMTCNGSYNQTCGTVGSINIEEEFNLSYRLYPNPMQAFSTLELDNPNQDKLLFKLLDASGRVVIGPVYIASSTYQINRNSLPSGLYFYQITSSSGKTFSGKLIMQ